MVKNNLDAYLRLWTVEKYLNLKRNLLLALLSLMENFTVAERNKMAVDGLATINIL